jgi:hypothetical protein
VKRKRKQLRKLMRNVLCRMKVRHVEGGYSILKRQTGPRVALHNYVSYTEIRPYEVE